MTNTDFSENTLVEQPTNALFGDLGYSTTNATLGRETKADVVLVPKLKAALKKVTTLKEIEAQGWSLNLRRYFGVMEKGADSFVFTERLEELNEELEVLNSEARELEDRIAANVVKLLEAVI
jgi:hypothetical protein